MTKKDYQALARMMWNARRTPLSPEEGMRREIMGKLADVLAADNPRFDRERFIRACETGECKGMPR